MTLKGVGGGTRILGKRENRGISRMGDRILMKLIGSQMLCFKFRLDLGTIGVEGETEILKTGKRLEWRDRNET